MRKICIALLLFLCSCSHVPQNPPNSTKTQLDEIVENYHQFEDLASPFNLPEPGGNNAKLPDLSPEKLADDHQKLTAIYQQLLTVNTTSLPQSKLIDLSILKYRIKNQLDSYINKEHYMPLTAESGFHAYVSFINGMVNMKTEQDFIDYIARLNQIPRYFAQQQTWMEKGIQEGRTQPQVVLEGFEDSIAAFIKEDITQSVYFTPFKSMPSYIPQRKQEALIQEAKLAIADKVIPSYKRYYEFFIKRYKPNARQNIAATSLPNGNSYYENRVAHYSTLNLTSDEIHRIGLAEVKRIRAEMEAIIDKLEFEGTFADFVEFLRTDPQFYATTPENLLKEASFIAKKMDAKLPSLFKTLPRTPYGVIEVPANIAPKYTTGRYSGPSRDDQPGNYWVNTYRLDRRPLYVLEALTLHEAVPGHHLQGSIAREMKDVPKFRNRTYISAFGEGWGLYSEYLGVEAGFYQDPYSDFGRLTYEMWRACRLVVDTGMHAKGWSRERAMNYLASNTALSLHNVKTEIDRYISWPAQALSYKLGELAIKRLRQEAESALAEKFDIREFHDRILENGSMPLSMLEQVIRDYIKAKQKELNV
ncbi:DUF885 domain-containing protein [Thalassotalea atypica]|uniref:DUF885 domain-containing protein n=1 Tax=Thalassotalea atypica TaxID=2054316 RepID=UPI002572F648|nr:DUF885 domain-containing protein [Thalassotalea atypica]